MTLETAQETTTARPARWRVRWSFVVAGVAIAGAILYLVIANTGASARYYMTVGELRACAACASQTVRVAGTVVDGSVTRDAASQTVRFAISDGTAASGLKVAYGGVVPDVFKAGVQVVVEGHLDRGVFQASSLLAKCPSKFQSATPGASGASGASGSLSSPQR